MSSSVLKRSVSSLNKKGFFNNKFMSFFGLRGGKLMEGTTRNRFEIVEVERNFISDILVGIGERSKIFYNKYLRSTVSYDYLEVKRIREKNIENVLWDTIRNQ